MTVASGLTSPLASATELKTGRPRWSLPPFPGDTPPTMFVPYSMAWRQGWKKPGFKKKKNQPSGFLLGFLFFRDFLGFFWFFGGFICLSRRESFRGFSVSRILIGASRR